MSSVFGILKVVDKQVNIDHVEWIGFEEDSEETPHLLGITSSLLSVNKKLPFRLYWEHFYRTGEYVVHELED